MNIPEAAIEAAATAVVREGIAWFHRDVVARAAVEAAMPAIREAIAREIEALPFNETYGQAAYQRGLQDAARIVRGGTP